MELTTKTAITENENPPAKSLIFTNGGELGGTMYKECLKNHAASLGGHAVDGCGEFMSAPTAITTDPTSLRCDACGCHRNFHRREDDPAPITTHFLDFHRHPPPQPPPLRRSSPLSSSSPPPPQPSSYYSSAPHMLLALRTAVPEDQLTVNNHPVATPATPTAAKTENSNGRKRFRTKFSQEQKEKMLSFAEKLGWKMQKCEEGLVEEFCSEVGVGKGVLKVWMHNNKHTSAKTATATAAINSSSTINGRVLNDHMNSSAAQVTTNHSLHHLERNNGVHLHISTNGSPPSSA
ncbi:Zinc-finger homeodomain protein [Sarracenia purpurea var. burkii]